MSENLTRKNFNEFYLSDGMLETLDKIGYKTPTPVQANTIPLVMAGIDLIVQSQTGTGKTAAFALPILSLIDPSVKSPQALILAPTRELALQVAEACVRPVPLRRQPGMLKMTRRVAGSYAPDYDSIALEVIGLDARPSEVLVDRRSAPLWYFEQGRLELTVGDHFSELQIAFS